MVQSQFYWISLALTLLLSSGAKAIAPPIPPPVDDFADVDIEGMVQKVEKQLDGQEVITQLPMHLQEYSLQSPVMVKPNIESWLDKYAIIWFLGLCCLMASVPIIGISLLHNDECFCDSCLSKRTKVETKEEEYNRWHQELQEFIDSIGTKS